MKQMQFPKQVIMNAAVAGASLPPHWGAKWQRLKIGLRATW